MSILRQVDYIWSVGELYHRREKGPGDGETLIMWCWYLDALLPLAMFIYSLDVGLIFHLIVLLIFLSLPFVFCKWRYTRKRRETILVRFHCKYPGRKLLFIWAVWSVLHASKDF